MRGLSRVVGDGADDIGEQRQLPWAGLQPGRQDALDLPCEGGGRDGRVRRWREAIAGPDPERVGPTLLGDTGPAGGGSGRTILPASPSAAQTAPPAYVTFSITPASAMLVVTFPCASSFQIW